MSDEFTTRSCLRIGDCFTYIDHPGKPHLAGRKLIVAYRRPTDLPLEWRWSGFRMGIEQGTWRVQRVKRWNDPTTQPAVLARVPSMDAFAIASQERVDGLTGLECLARYEEAMRFEDLRRTGPHTFVTSRLTSAQVMLAQRVWQAKLRSQIARTAERERTRVTCDPVDEMPNMEIV